SAAQRARRDELDRQLSAAQGALDAKAARVTATDWEKTALARYNAGKLNWKFQRPISAASANGATLTVYNDRPAPANATTTTTAAPKPGNGLIVASGPNPDNETYTVRVKPGAGEWATLGLDVVPDDSLPGVNVARGADRLVITEVDAEISEKDARTSGKLAFVLAASSIKEPSVQLPAMAAIDGNPNTGWGIDTYGESGDLFLALRFKEPLRTRDDSVLTIRVHHDSQFRRATIGRFRIALAQSDASWPDASHDRKKNDKGVIAGGLSKDMVKALGTAAAKRTGVQKKLLLEYLDWATPELEPQTAAAANLRASLDLLDAAIPHVVVTEATTPRPIRILPRANWMDESGAIVEPAIPELFGKVNTGGARATRLDLANWIVSPDNPLTARVFVNREWRHFFGTGLSKVLEDLGSQGEWPTHPGLLDWLAAEFVHPSWDAAGAHDWDVKHIIRTIVLSQTYRQSSQSTPALDDRDPGNRLLARQSRFRVDAEVVHDIALEVSGLLVEKFGGPSVRPYQPAGYLAALNFPKREYSASRGDDLYRRGIYTQWQRTFLHPSLQAFDAPSREECTVNRVNSNTPLQALVLLNDPIYVETARVFAESVLEKGGHAGPEQIDWAFQHALNRKPTAEERRILLTLHRQSLERFRAAPSQAGEFIRVGQSPAPKTLPPAELAAMTAVTRAILNLHETITRN
ncbi:MAG: DUF1553 domain-containing protein, partial [Bryobacteraceae bacterium]